MLFFDCEKDAQVPDLDDLIYDGEWEISQR